jgi:hypothetical protein
MRNARDQSANGRNNLPRLRAADDLAARDPARIRREPECVSVEAMRVLDDGAGKLDDTPRKSQTDGVIGADRRSGHRH